MVAVSIQTKDGKIIRIERDISNLLTSIPNDIDVKCPKNSSAFSVFHEILWFNCPTRLDEVSKENDELHSVDINSDILKEIIEWCKYHKRCVPEKDNKQSGHRSSWKLCEWDKGFFLKNRQKFGEIVDAAILLDMEHLCDACSIYITERFREYKEYGESLKKGL